MDFVIKPFYDNEIIGAFEIETKEERIIYSKGSKAMSLQKSQNTVTIEPGYNGTLGKMYFFTLLKDKIAAQLWKDLRTFPSVEGRIIVPLNLK